MKKISVPITVEYLCTGCSIYMYVYSQSYSSSSYAYGFGIILDEHLMISYERI